jgi:hypothetical protein
MPPMWNSGRPESQTSSLVAPISRIQFTVFATSPRWVSMAPLGCPVVPEVYISRAISVSSTTASGGVGVAARRASS